MQRFIYAVNTHGLIIVRNETNDERQIGVKEIFAALELHHTRYVNPPIISLICSFSLM